MNFKIAANVVAALSHQQNQSSQQSAPLTRTEAMDRLLGDPDFDHIRLDEDKLPGSDLFIKPNPASQKPVPVSPAHDLACRAVGGCGVDPDFA